MRVVELVWCSTCEHTHIPTIPVVTYRCLDCGFGGWTPELATDHERRCPHHRAVPIVHNVVEVMA